MDAAEREIIRLDDVRFSYPDGTLVLERFSESIEKAKTVGIVGPSGCGKSTLLALIAGLLHPTGGTIERRMDPSRGHPLSMVFQKDTLLPWLTVTDNVRFFSRFKHQAMRPKLGERMVWRRGRSQAARALDERVGFLLEMAHLSDHARRFPYQLSGGMRRRLAFLAAVAPNPQVLLLDEPFSSLDEPTRIGIHEDVFRIGRMMNMTTILVTHDLGEAVTMCDRVLILTSAPARIAGRFPVPFGEEREMLKLRETPEFLDLYGKLWHQLSQQIEAARSPANGIARRSMPVEDSHESR